MWHGCCPCCALLHCAAAGTSTIHCCMNLPLSCLFLGWTRQGEATAALAVIASRNKAHLPEFPLEDAGAGPPVRPLGDILSHSRLRRRLGLLLALWPLAWSVYLGTTLLLAARVPGWPLLNLIIAFGVDAAMVAAAAPLTERLGRCSITSVGLAAGANFAEIHALVLGLLVEC